MLFGVGVLCRYLYCHYLTVSFSSLIASVEGCSFCYRLLVILLFMLGVSSSSGCLEKAALVYSNFISYAHSKGGDRTETNITQTCLCNKLQYFTAVKMLIFS